MTSSDPPIITLLTDFGPNGAPAVCHGVILSICRTARIIDVGHAVPKYAISDGAFLMRLALPWMPVGVHVGVVDPGVGTDRRPIGIRTARGDMLIGPDNGLLLPAADTLGGAVEARELANRALWLAEISATFHGRDIFSPVAAHLAAGDATFDAVGPAIAIDSLVRLHEPRARVTDGAIETEVTWVDSFGNLRLAGGEAEFRAAFGEPVDGDRFRVRVGAETTEATFARSFGHVEAGSTIMYVDSSGDLALGANQADLAARLAAGSGMVTGIERA